MGFNGYGFVLIFIFDLFIFIIKFKQLYDEVIEIIEERNGIAIF